MSDKKVIPAAQEIRNPDKIKRLLRNIYEFEVKTKYDAIAIIHLRSALNSGDDRLLKAAYAHLNNCVECKIHEEEGLSVRRQAKKVRTYNDSKLMKKLLKEQDDLKARLEELKKEIEDEGNRVGFWEEEGTVFYVAVKSKPTL